MSAMIAPRNASSEISRSVGACFFKAADVADSVCAVATASTLLHSQVKILCRLGKPSVARIKNTVTQPRGGQPMHVDPTEAKTVQAVHLHKTHYFFVPRCKSRQSPQQAQRSSAVAQRPAGEFSQH